MSENNDNFMQKMSELKDIVSTLRISDDADINPQPMIEADNFFNSYDLTLLFNDTADDNPDMEVTTDEPTTSEVKDNSTENGQTSQDACLEEAKGDSKKEDEEQLHIDKFNELKTLANDAFNARQFEDALKYLNEAIEIIPNDSSSYCNRAVTYINLCCYQKAIEDCETTLQFTENFLRAWLYMAKCYYILGNEELSKECVREAIARNPADIIDIELYEQDFRKNDVS